MKLNTVCIKLHKRITGALHNILKKYVNGCIMCYTAQNSQASKMLQPLSLGFISLVILKLCIYPCVMAAEVSLPKRKNRLWDQLGQLVWLCQCVVCPLLGFSGQSCPFISLQRRHPPFGWRDQCLVAFLTLEEAEISREAKLQLAEANGFCNLLDF